jgi:hypothetical protein
MREEDRRGGSGKINTEGFSKPLGWGEQQALAMQAKNRRVSEGDPNEVRERQAAAAVDMTLKAPRAVAGEPKTGSSADLTRPPDPRGGR